MRERAITAALDLARLRHLALAGGDFEGYAETDEAFSQACEALAGAALGPGHVQQLNELVSLETQSVRLLEALKAEASETLASLRRTHQLSGAYAAQQAAP